MNRPVTVAQLLFTIRPWRGVGSSTAIACSAAICLALLIVTATGCVSKAKADERVKAAFMAGQQQAMTRAQQSQTGGDIMIIGAVKNNMIPWTAGLTLANALIDADYIGQTDPKEILINRNGQQIPIDPKLLLSGKDVPLQSNDIVEVR